MQDPLTAVLDTDAAYGSVALNADGSFTYTPTQNFFGQDSFRYFATDGISNSNTVEVEIWVTAVNDVPIANDDSYSTTEDIPTGD